MFWLIHINSQVSLYQSYTDYTSITFTTFYHRIIKWQLTRAFSHICGLLQYDVTPILWWRWTGTLSDIQSPPPSLRQPVLHDVIPNGGYVVSSPVPGYWRIYGSDVNCLLQSPFKPFGFYAQYFFVYLNPTWWSGWDCLVWMCFWDLWYGGTWSPVFAKLCLQWSLSLSHGRS